MKWLLRLLFGQKERDRTWVKVTMTLPTFSKENKVEKWSYFKDAEVEGLVEDLVFKLDRARDFYGHPIVITSGYRNPEHNKAVGGVEDSSHTRGMAVDIRVPQDQELREKLIWAIGAAGFRRVGCYDRHIHLDVDARLPYPSFWTGVSK